MGYGYDPFYGHLIAKDYKPTYFNETNVLDCLNDLHIKIYKKIVY